MNVMLNYHAIPLYTDLSRSDDDSGLGAADIACKFHGAV